MILWFLFKYIYEESNINIRYLQNGTIVYYNHYWYTHIFDNFIFGHDSTFSLTVIMQYLFQKCHLYVSAFKLKKKTLSSCFFFLSQIPHHMLHTISVLLQNGSVPLCHGCQLSVVHPKTSLFGINTLWLCHFSYSMIILLWKGYIASYWGQWTIQKYHSCIV